MNKTRSSIAKSILALLVIATFGIASGCNLFSNTSTAAQNIYVTSAGGGVWFFPLTANGNVAPAQNITGANHGVQ